MVQLFMAFLTFLAIALASYIRIKLSFLNLWHDEVYTLMAAKGAILHLMPQMPSGLLYIRSFPLTYLTAASLKIFGSSELAVRLPTITIGIISIIIFYLTASKVIGRKAAIVSSFILSLSPWHIMYSIFARSYLMQGLLFFLTGWFYYRYMEKKNINFLYYAFWAILISSLLSPESVLNIFMLGFVTLFTVIENRKTLNGKTITALSLNLAAILVAVFLPSVVIPWQKELSANPYGLLEIRKILLPNRFFFSTMEEFFPIGFPMFILSIPLLWIKDRKFLIFPAFILGSFVLLSIFNPFGNLQPRYLSNFIFAYYFTVFYAGYKLFSKRNSSAALIFLFFIVSDLWYFPQIYSLNYGKKIPPSSLVSLSWTELPDTKSQTEYVNNNYRQGDIVISLQTKGQTEIYLKPRLDYILRTRNYMNEGHMQNHRFVDDYSAIPIITSSEQLKKLVEKSEARIWLISSKSQNTVLEHIDRETYNYIIGNFSHNLIYKGRDDYSRTYLINKK